MKELGVGHSKESHDPKIHKPVALCFLPGVCDGILGAPVGLGSHHLFKSVVGDVGGYVATLLAHIPDVYNILEFPQLLDLGFTFPDSLTACSGAPQREFDPALSGITTSLHDPCFLVFCMSTKPAPLG